MGISSYVSEKISDLEKILTNSGRMTEEHRNYWRGKHQAFVEIENFLAEESLAEYLKEDFDDE